MKETHVVCKVFTGNRISQDLATNCQHGGHIYIVVAFTAYTTDIVINGCHVYRGCDIMVQMNHWGRDKPAKRSNGTLEQICFFLDVTSFPCTTEHGFVIVSWKLHTWQYQRLVAMQNTLCFTNSHICKTFSLSHNRKHTLKKKAKNRHKHT